MGIDLGRFKRNKNDDWVDWLADDPVPVSIRSKMRAKAVQEASRPVVRRPGQPADVQQNQAVPEANRAAISINITIPKLKLNKPSVKIPPQLVSYKKWLLGGVVVVMLTALGATVLITRNDSTDGDAPAVLAENNQKADFAYALPKGETEGLKAEPRYDSQRKVVAYKDSIGGVEITISQQPLPEGLKEDTQNKIKKLAEDFSATKVLATANPTAYLGTSAKGPQTVIFSKMDLLVFIQSAKEIDDTDWAEYITNLK